MFAFLLTYIYNYYKILLLSIKKGGVILQIYSKNIYSITANNTTQNILILYNISGNHYVGLPVHDKEVKDCVYISTINKYVVIKELREYSRKNIKRLNICKRKIFKS